MDIYNKLRLSLFALCLSVLTASNVFAETHPKTVLVGLAHFPPYIEINDDKVGGIAAQMLDLMNAHQDKYEFVAIPTLASTRHKLFELGRYDMSMFDSLDWGWEGLDAEASMPYLQGGEVYITTGRYGRDESYFSNFREKIMVGIEGYHYGFAQFNNDKDYLKSHYNMILTTSNLGSIKLIASGKRGDIAVVTKSFLAQYLQQFPEDKTKLLVSEKQDQEYNHRIIIRKGIAPSVQEINSLLKALTDNQKLPNLWKQISSDNLY